MRSTNMQTCNIVVEDQKVIDICNSINQDNMNENDLRYCVDFLYNRFMRAMQGDEAKAIITAVLMDGIRLGKTDMVGRTITHICFTNALQVINTVEDVLENLGIPHDRGMVCDALMGDKKCRRRENSDHGTIVINLDGNNQSLN